MIWVSASEDDLSPDNLITRILFEPNREDRILENIVLPGTHQFQQQASDSSLPQILNISRTRIASIRRTEAQSENSVKLCIVELQRQNIGNAKRKWFVLRALIRSQSNDVTQNRKFRHEPLIVFYLTMFPLTAPEPYRIVNVLFKSFPVVDLWRSYRFFWATQS